ncbi:uncharacterized protein [Dermacentor albipictus]|uniref:uncharacterized protein n=1 Tax=Dermacentor albipictus TaxID=60249 RepID=UPI0031FC9890
MEAEQTLCSWSTCGQPLQARPGARFAKCYACCHINCLKCKAAHEGMNCAEFQALRGPAVKSPVRSPTSAGARSKSFDTWSPRSSKGDPASPKDSAPSAASATTLPRPLSVNASASFSSTWGPRSAAVTRQSTSPSKKPVEVDLETKLGDQGATHQQRKAICRTEDCGYEDYVDAGETKLFCYKCRKTTCLQCNAVHGYLTCKEYRRQLDDEEDEMQVRCAGTGCEFTAFVGVSAEQLKCQLCESITCLKCCAVHEFRTCEAYEQERRRSQRESAAATAGEPSETYPEKPNTRTSRGDDSESRDRPPACVAAAKAAINREAAMQKELLVQKAANSMSNGRTETESHRSETVPKQLQPGHSSWPESARAAAAQVEVLMLECSACLAESPYEDLVEVAPCGHFLCRECIHTTGVGSLTYVVRCPVVTEGGVSCDSYIQESALKSVMTEREYALHKELLPLAILRCPVEGCPGKFSVRPGTQRLSCPSCRNEYCVACSTIHPGRTCEQFIRSVVNDGAALDEEASETPASSSTSVNEPQVVSSGAVEGVALKTPLTSFTVECCQCLAETPFGEIVDLLWCGHLLCRDCVHRTAVNSTTYLVRCPVTPERGAQCQSYIQESALKSVLSVQELAHRKEVAQRQSSQSSGVFPNAQKQKPTYDSDEFDSY